MSKEQAERLWPELQWIENEDLRRRVRDVWAEALERSVLSADDLERIPFTLKAPGCTVSFMAHKRSVVHIAFQSAKTMKEFFGDQLPIDLDTVVAGSILIDVGKLLEYDLDDKGELMTGSTGKFLRHPFTGVSLAMKHGLPDPVCHMIATHAGEGNLGKRSVESTIAHHVDFMTFEPFVDRIV
ncbi:MAG: HD domain-containing protein [Candidatus Eisenbacteria bacterium]